MNLGSRRRRGAPSRETLQDARDLVAMHTGGLRPGGLRCDFERLPEDDQRRVVELVGAAAKGRSWSWGRLSEHDRATFESLVEKASGEPGIFAAARELAEISALAAEAHQIAVRRPLSRKQENSVFQEIGRCVGNCWLDVADLAVLTSFVTAFVSGRPLGPLSRVERFGDETVLVIDDANMGPFSGMFDAEGQIGPRWQMNLAHLETNEWVAVRRNGKQWTVRPGNRLRQAMAGRRIRDKVQAA